MRSQYPFGYAYATDHIDHPPFRSTAKSQGVRVGESVHSAAQMPSATDAGGARTKRRAELGIATQTVTPLPSIAAPDRPRAIAVQRATLARQPYLIDKAHLRRSFSWLRTAISSAVSRSPSFPILISRAPCCLPLGSKRRWPSLAERRRTSRASSTQPCTRAHGERHTMSAPKTAQKMFTQPALCTLLTFRQKCPVVTAKLQVRQNEVVDRTEHFAGVPSRL